MNLKQRVARLQRRIQSQTEDACTCGVPLTITQRGETEVVIWNGCARHRKRVAEVMRLRGVSLADL